MSGFAWGAGFSAILLIRYGMDYDGDHANFVAVLDILSAQLQETYLTPENRLFMDPASWLWPLLAGLWKGGARFLKETTYALRVKTLSGFSAAQGSWDR